MALRLPPVAPVWTDLPRGVRVRHRRATPPDASAAAAWARRRAQETADEHAARARDALGHVAPPDPEGVKQLEWGYFVLGLGRLCIEAWEGVEADCTPENVEALLTMPDMAAAWVDHAMAAVMALRSEGNASAPAPTGITAGAPNTAADAGPAA